MAEQFSNNASSLLDGSITSEDTTLNVLDASSFPTEGNFRLLIDTEYLLVTAVAANQFTVERGAEGSAPSSHDDLSIVLHVLTAGALQEIASGGTGTQQTSLGATFVIGTAPSYPLISPPLYLPADFTITACFFSNDDPTTIAAADILYGTTPATDDMTSICGGNEPVLATEEFVLQTDLTDWTTLLEAGNYVRFVISSNDLGSELSIQLI